MEYQCSVIRSFYRCVIFAAAAFGISSTSIRHVFRDKAGPGRESLYTDVLLSSTLAQVHYISLLSVGVRACVDLYPFFALARVYAHELGNLLGHVRV